MPNNISESTYMKKTGLGLWHADLFIFDSLPSTNAWAMDNIHKLKHGDVVFAINQTAGRGRFNRAWIAPDGSNLSISVIVDHDKNDIPAAMLLPSTAIAIRDTLKEFKIEASLKWPNDVMVSGKKIAGILAELEPENNYLVIGIGLNINIPRLTISKMDFPQPPTSMMAEKGCTFNVANVCNVVIRALEKTINMLYKKGIPYISERWQENDYLTEQTLSINTNTGIVTGKYAGMKNNGQLEIIDLDGDSHLFWSGDVTLCK